MRHNHPGQTVLTQLVNDVDVIATTTLSLPNGTELHCRFAGDPAGRPMLLMHALGESGSDWDPVVPALSVNSRLVIPDLRGHGASKWSGPYTFESMRDDVLALLDRLRIQQIVVVGHSMGAALGWVLAQTAPQRVSHLIIEDAPPPFPRENRVRERPLGTLPFDWEAVVAIAGQVNDPMRRWWPGLGDLPMPVLVISGGPRSSIPQAEVAAAAAAVPDGTLITLDAGHHVHRSMPQAWTEAILGWLSDKRGESETA